MATAYTPGLAVSRHTHIRKLRRLPLAGEVLVQPQDAVEYDQVIARAELPGIMRTVRTAETLGVDPKELHQFLQVEEGDHVEKGQVLARSTSFWGLFKTESRANVSGKIELINPISGNIGIREAPSPVEITAYVKGRVAEIIPTEGAVIETEGALIQGIFGVGGEKSGVLKPVVSGPDQRMGPDDLPEDAEGQILVGGAGATLEAVRAAAAAGACGLVIGGLVDEDLVAYLGHDIGVAITGQEPVPMTLIITEGFGSLAMARRTWELFQELEGQRASINGATQIRAGVIRPEVIVPGDLVDRAAAGNGESMLDIGSPIRLIREPYFGLLGKVEELPPDLEAVPSGAQVRVLVARLEDGRVVRTPRANVELIEQ